MVSACIGHTLKFGQSTAAFTPTHVFWRNQTHQKRLYCSNILLTNTGFTLPPNSFITSIRVVFLSNSSIVKILYSSSQEQQFLTTEVLFISSSSSLSLTSILKYTFITPLSFIQNHLEVSRDEEGLGFPPSLHPFLGVYSPAHFMTWCVM